MKRYYIVADADIPVSGKHSGRAFGEWHAIDLSSHDKHIGAYHVVVLVEDHIEAPPEWHELPHPLDAKASIADPEHEKHLDKLQAIKAPPDAGGYALAKHLAGIHPKFRL